MNIKINNSKLIKNMVLIDHHKIKFAIKVANISWTISMVLNGFAAKIL